VSHIVAENDLLPSTNIKITWESLSLSPSLAPSLMFFCFSVS
jgi:hypothetical protein